MMGNASSESQSQEDERNTSIRVPTVTLRNFGSFIKSLLDVRYILDYFSTQRLF